MNPRSWSRPRCRGRAPGVEVEVHGVEVEVSEDKVEVPASVEVPGLKLKGPWCEVVVPEIEVRATFRQPSPMSRPCRASGQSPTGIDLGCRRNQV